MPTKVPETGQLASMPTLVGLVNGQVTGKVQYQSTKQPLTEATWWRERRAYISQVPLPCLASRGSLVAYLPACNPGLPNLRQPSECPAPSAQRPVILHLASPPANSKRNIHSKRNTAKPRLYQLPIPPSDTALFEDCVSRRALPIVTATRSTTAQHPEQPATGAWNQEPSPVQPTLILAPVSSRIFSLRPETQHSRSTLARDQIQETQYLYTFASHTRQQWCRWQVASSLPLSCSPSRP